MLSGFEIFKFFVSDHLNRYCLFVCYLSQVGSIMNESDSDSNPGSSDLNVDKSAIEFILSRQVKRFSILTEK